MEVFVYGLRADAHTVQSHISNKRPKIWRDAEGMVIVRAGNVEINYTADDLRRIAQCHSGIGAAV